MAEKEWDRHAEEERSKQMSEQALDREDLARLWREYRAEKATEGQCQS